MMRNIPGLLLAFSLLGGGAAAEPFAVHLHSTLPSPQPVGTSIGLSPRVENAAKGMQVFRYAASVNGGPFHVIRDFSQDRDFAWTPDLYEHDTAIRVTARNNETKETAEDELRFQIVSRIKGTDPAVTPTAHPLVALFSAPPCPKGSSFRIAFRAEGEESIMRTPSQACRPSLSNNVYVAGMRAATDYRMRSEVVEEGSVRQGEWLPFHTGLLDGSLSPVAVTVPHASGSPVTEPVVIYSATSLNSEKHAFATDLEGRVIWYLRSADFLIRVIPGGRFLLQGTGLNSVNDTRQEQLLREVDLAGNVVRETNAGRVAEQLAAFGIHSDCKQGGKECVSGFHHEAIRLPNGHTLVIAGLERMMPTGTQGSKEPVDILGDLVVDLDVDFQVAGVWNCFDHLDIARKSFQDAKCKTGEGGCPPILLTHEANGWTHSNSLNYIPSTGDFLVSIPEQGWVVRVDWKNGKGSGKILWRLGEGGDFKVAAKDPKPWFSYAHDVGFEPAGSNILTLMDNAAVYGMKDKKVQSRSQVWSLDEANRTASLVYNVELGAFTICCGSAQTLKNGGYNTVAGWIDPASPRGTNVETDKDGKTVYATVVEGAVVYRSFRVDDLYSAPAK